MAASIVRHKYVVPICLCLITLVLYQPTLRAGFVLVDDHQILAFTPSARADAQLAPALDFAQHVFVDDPESARVRPLYWVIRLTQIALLDANPMAWHALYLMFAGTASCLLYAALRGAGCLAFPSFLAAAWLLAAPGVSSVWIMLGPQESLGTVLITIGMWAAVKAVTAPHGLAWDWLGALSVSAAALVKESFTLVPPAYIGFRVLLGYSANRWPCQRRVGTPGVVFVPLVIGAATFGIVYYTAIRSAATSYGGEILAGTSTGITAQTLANVQILAVLGGVEVPLLAAGWIIFVIRRGGQLEWGTRTWLLWAGVAVLLIAPQLVLYNGAPGFGVGRYLLPAGLGLAASTAAAMSWLITHRLRALFLTCATLWVVDLCVFSFWTNREAVVFQADSAKLAETADSIVAAAPIGSTVLVAADPVKYFEFAYSMQFQIVSRGRSDIDLELMMLSQDPDSELEQRWRRILGSFFPGRIVGPERGCERLAAVVILAPESLIEQALPCLSQSDFEERSFDERIGPPPLLPSALGQIYGESTVGYSALLRSHAT